MEKWIAGEAIADAVNLANDLRRSFGIELLDDLPAATPTDAHNCVLAKAFNFDCWVEAGENSEWGVHFDNADRDKAEKLATLLRTEVHETEDWTGTLIVDLPNRIGKIAQRFDEEALDDKYYQGYNPSVKEYI